MGCLIGASKRMVQVKGMWYPYRKDPFSLPGSFPAWCFSWHFGMNNAFQLEDI